MSFLHLPKVCNLDAFSFASSATANRRHLPAALSERVYRTPSQRRRHRARTSSPRWRRS